MSLYVYAPGRLRQCQLCQRVYQNLTVHVRRAHNISPAEYKARLGLPEGEPLHSFHHIPRPPGAPPRWSRNITPAQLDRMIEISCLWRAGYTVTSIAAAVGLSRVHVYAIAKAMRLPERDIKGRIRETRLKPPSKRPTTREKDERRGREIQTRIDALFADRPAT